MCTEIKQVFNSFLQRNYSFSYKYSEICNLNKAVNGRVAQKSRGLTSAAQFVDVTYLDFSKPLTPCHMDFSWLLTALTGALFAA